MKNESLEIVKKAVKYIPGVVLSGSVRLLEFGLKEDDLNDIDLFVTNEVTGKAVNEFLNDNGYEGDCFDVYKHIKTTTFKKSPESIYLPIEVNIALDKTPQPVQVLLHKMERYFNYPASNEKDYWQIRKVLDWLHKEQKSDGSS